MRKMLAVLMMIALLASNLIVISYAETGDEYHVYGNEITAKSGEYIQVPVKIENNNGLMGFKITVHFDSGALKPIDVKRGTVTSGGMFINSISSNTVDSFDVIWTNDADVMSDGELFYLSFLVNSAETERTNIDFTYSQYDTFDESWNDVVMTFESIGVNIAGSVSPENPPINPMDPSEGNTVIYSKDIYTDVPGRVSVPVYIRNNNGIMGYKLSFEYDKDILTPVDVKSATTSGYLADNIGLDEGVFSVVWNNNENNYENGLLFEIEFDVKSVEPAMINFSYSSDDTFDENWDDVKLFCAPIKVNHRYIKSINERTTIDFENKMILGVNPEDLNLENHISACDGYTYTVEKSSKVVGTGSTIIVSENGTVVDKFSVVIFGDVNGDGWYDGMDSIIVSMIANGMLTKDQVGEAVYMAADCNHDGAIDELDVELLQQAGLLLANVDQSKSKEEL